VSKNIKLICVMEYMGKPLWEIPVIGQLLTSAWEIRLFDIHMVLSAWRRFAFCECFLVVECCSLNVHL